MYLMRLLSVSSVLALCLLLNLHGISNGEEDNEIFLKWENLNKRVVSAYQQGDYNAGVKFAQEAFQYAKEKFGEKHPSTLTSMNNLAELYRAQGRYGEAEPLYKQALQLSQEVL